MHIMHFLKKYDSHKSEMSDLLNVRAWGKLEEVHSSSNQSYRQNLSFVICIEEYYQISSGY